MKLKPKRLHFAFATIVFISACDYLVDAQTLAGGKSPVINYSTVPFSVIPSVSSSISGNVSTTNASAEARTPLASSQQILPSTIQSETSEGAKTSPPVPSTNASLAPSPRQGIGALNNGDDTKEQLDALFSIKSIAFHQELNVKSFRRSNDPSSTIFLTENDLINFVSMYPVSESDTNPAIPDLDWAIRTGILYISNEDCNAIEKVEIVTVEDTGGTLLVHPIAWNTEGPGTEPCGFADYISISATTKPVLFAAAIHAPLSLRPTGNPPFFTQ